MLSGSCYKKDLLSTFILLGRTIFEGLLTGRILLLWSKLNSLFCCKPKGMNWYIPHILKQYFFWKLLWKQTHPLLHPVIAQLIPKATQASQIQSSPPMESNYWSCLLLELGSYIDPTNFVQPHRTFNYMDPMWGEDEAVLTSPGHTHHARGSQGVKRVVDCTIGMAKR